MKSVLRILALLLVGAMLAGNCMSLSAAEGSGEHSGGEHGQADSGKVPGLVPFSQDLPLWSLVTFLLMFGVLAKFVWPPLASGLSERERRIRQDIADAEANRLKSESLIAEREAKLAGVQDEIRTMLAEARSSAERLKQDILATAQRDAEATKQSAIVEIERSRDRALTELFDFVSSNVVDATQRIIGRSLDAADQERLVKQALAEMDLRKN